MSSAVFSSKERDYRENWEVDQFREDSAEIHQFVNNNDVSIGEEAGKDDPAAESNNDSTEYRNYKNKNKTHHHHHRLRMSSSQEPSRNFMKHTESSKRKSKSWNEIQNNINNNNNIVSNFRTKSGIIRVSRHANDQKKQPVDERNKGRVHSSCKQKQHDKRKKQQQHSDSDKGESDTLSSSSRTSLNYSSSASPLYYISRDGSVQTRESFTQKCGACEMDLFSPFEETEDKYYYRSDEGDFRQPFRLPDVAVWACGHLFHCRCLDEEDQSSDPPCFLCLGLYS